MCRPAVEQERDVGAIVHDQGDCRLLAQEHDAASLVEDVARPRAFVPDLQNSGAGF